MFKVIADLDDPTQTKTVDILSFFNPTLNPPPALITVKQFVNSLKVIYSRENILAHPEYYFRFQTDNNLSTDEFADTVKKIIKPILDDQLWLLYYIIIQRVYDNNTFVYTAIRWADAYEHSTGWYFHPYNNHSKRTQYSFRGNNYEAEIQAIFNDHYNSYIKLAYDQGENKPVSNGLVEKTYVNCSFASTWQRYILGQGFCHGGDGGWLSARNVIRILSFDPNSQFVNQPLYAGDVTLTLRTVISKANKTPLYTMRSYSASPTNILDWPLIAKGEHDPIVYGVEMELSTDYTVQNLVDATDEPFFIVKQDSSVSGSRRFKYELATIPMSFKMHKKQWAYWFSNLDYEKFDTSKETNNGMHVHISREAFADKAHIKHFVWFFTQPAHAEFMRFFSQRDAQSFRDYSNVPNTHTSSRVQAFRRNEDHVKDLRGAVHFSGKGTMEVRLFKGIVSLADMIKNLEFVDSVFHYTMLGQTFTKLSLHEYINWLHKQPRNKYVILKKYLERTDRLKKLVNAAEILNLVFNEQSPKKILEIVSKSKLTVTNDHVSLLNSRWKKRIFILKDGQLILNPDNQSNLSFLDRLIEKKILHGVKKETMIIQPSPDDNQTARRGRRARVSGEDPLFD